MGVAAPISSEAFLNLSSSMLISPSDHSSFLPVIDVVTYSLGLVLSLAGSGMDISYVNKTISLS